MQIHRLRDSGLELMHQWLDAGASSAASVPDDLLSAGHAEPTVYGAIDPHRKFASRFEWATYIEDTLASESIATLQRDKGMWAWLSLVYFDQVCPRDGAGNRKVAQRARYVPAGSDFRTAHRHLLQGPWRLVRAHSDGPERVSPLLAGALHKPGDLYEQLAARLEIAGSRSVMEVARRLYSRADGDGLKRGAGGSGPGSPRRFAQVLRQFDLTYDVYGMDSTSLMTLLPSEFDRFR